MWVISLDERAETSINESSHADVFCPSKIEIIRLAVKEPARVEESDSSSKTIVKTERVLLLAKDLATHVVNNVVNGEASLILLSIGNASRRVVNAVFGGFIEEKASSRVGSLRRPPPDKLSSPSQQKAVPRLPTSVTGFELRQRRNFRQFCTSTTDEDPVGSGAAAIDSSESSLEPSAVDVFHSNDSKKIKLSLERGKRTRKGRRNLRTWYMLEQEEAKLLIVTVLVERIVVFSPAISSSDAALSSGAAALSSGAASLIKSFSALELANGASDGMVNQERLERTSQLAEIEDLQASCDLLLAPLFIEFVVVALELKWVDYAFVIMLPNNELRVVVFDADESSERMMAKQLTPIKTINRNGQRK
ncbi:hypothetical protein C3L33_06497, partial [Rhododendron williamsianum]